MVTEFCDVWFWFASLRLFVLNSRRLDYWHLHLQLFHLRFPANSWMLFLYSLFVTGIATHMPLNWWLSLFVRSSFLKTKVNYSGKKRFFIGYRNNWMAVSISQFIHKTGLSLFQHFKVATVSILIYIVISCNSWFNIVDSSKSSLKNWQKSIQKSSFVPNNLLLSH